MNPHLLLLLLPFISVIHGGFLSKAPFSQAECSKPVSIGTAIIKHPDKPVDTIPYGEGSSNMQKPISLLALAQHAHDYPVEFRRFLFEQFGIKLKYTTLWEAGHMVEDVFLYGDSIEIRKLYAPPTAILGRGKGVPIHYVENTKAFVPEVYAMVVEPIEIARKTGGSAFNEDYIEIRNIPTEVALQWRDEFVASGAAESPGCFTSEVRTFYCLQGKYSVTLTRWDAQTPPEDGINTYKIQIYMTE